MNSPAPCSRSSTATTRPPGRSTGTSPPQTWPGSSTGSAPASTPPENPPNYPRQPDDPRRTSGVTHLGVRIGDPGLARTVTGAGQALGVGLAEVLLQQPAGYGAD